MQQCAAADCARNLVRYHDISQLHKIACTISRCTLLHRCVICFHSIRPSFKLVINVSNLDKPLSCVILSKIVKFEWKLTKDIAMTFLTVKTTLQSRFYEVVQLHKARKVGYLYTIFCKFPVVYVPQKWWKLVGVCQIYERRQSGPFLKHTISQKFAKDIIEQYRYLIRTSCYSTC